MLLVLPASMLQAQGAFARPLPGGMTNGCDFCLAAQGISALEVGSSGIRIDLRFLHVGTIYRDGTRVENGDQELETHLTQQYSLFFALSSRFTLAAFLPVAKRYSERLADDRSLITGNQFGLGDVALLVRYKPLLSHTMDATTVLSVSAGVKLPSGRTDGRDSRGDLLDAHVQLGSGSTDLLVGASGIVAWEKTAVIANLLGALTTEGANGHRFGNMLNYDLAVRFRVFPDDYEGALFFATLGLSGEWRGRETLHAAPDPDSGGNVTYLAPGLQIMFTPAFSLEAAYQHPLVHALYGRQLGEDYRVMTGIQLLL
jgi:hypothetical protein